MNDPSIIAVALVSIIGSIAAGTVAIITALGKNKRELLEATYNQTRSLNIKSDQIHTLVNGKSEASEARVMELEKQIKELNQEINNLQEKRIQEALSGNKNGVING